MEFNEILLSLQPFTDLGSLVIRDIVRDHVNFRSVVVPNQLLEKIYESLSVEYLDEARVPFGLPADSYCPHDLLASPYGRPQNLGPNPYEGPGSVNRARLLKHGFILIQHDSFLPSRFFLFGAAW